MFTPILYFCHMSKKDSILKATLKLIVENGIQNTPLSLITKEANVGMGTVYNYFKTKEDIIRELYLRIKNEGAEYILKEYDNNLHVKQRYFLIMGSVVEYYLNNQFEFLFMEQIQFSPIIDNKTKAEASSYIIEMYRLFEEGQNQEIIKKANIKQQMYFVYGALASLIRLHIMEATNLDDSAIESAIKASWDAIKE